MINNSKKEKISFQIIKTLLNRFERFPQDSSNNRNAPFHEAFLNAFKNQLDDKVSDIPFFISLSSWFHGLNTTLGQSFFENIAHILCDGEKREYTSKKLGNLQVYTSQKSNINTIITNMSNAITRPDIKNENEQLFIISDSETLENAIDFSTDVFFEEDNKIIAVELKTVQPNSGEMRGEKQKILEAKAAFYNKFSGKDIEFYLGFPFDPTNDPSEPTGYDKKRFMNSCINMNKYFDEKEIKLANELWDFLSGDEDTMMQLLQMINSISTVDFMDNYRYLNNVKNRAEPKYSELLGKWNLYSEKTLIDNDDTIKEKIKKNKQITRIYNQVPFDKDGNYKIDRYLHLSELIVTDET